MKEEKVIKGDLSFLETPEGWLAFLEEGGENILSIQYRKRLEALARGRTSCNAMNYNVKKEK